MTIRTLRQRAKLARRMPSLYRNWPLALLSMGIHRRKPLVLRLRDGTQFCVRMRGLDTHIVNEVWADKIYTPDYAIGDGWTIVDIGGHKGIFAVFAATRAKDIKVYTFEPSPRNFPVLCQNLQLNGITNVRPFNVAVGAEDGESLLYLYPDDGQNTMLRRLTPGLECREHREGRNMVSAPSDPICRFHRQFTEDGYRGNGIRDPVFLFC